MFSRKSPLCSLVMKPASKPIDWLDVRFQWVKIPEATAVSGNQKPSGVQCCPTCRARFFSGLAKPS